MTTAESILVRDEDARIEAEPTSPLTDRQWDIFNFMVAYTVEHFYQPSFRETADHFGFVSKNGLYCHLKSLAKKGLLRLADGGRTGCCRSIEFLRRSPSGGKYNINGGAGRLETSPSSPLTDKQRAIFNWMVTFTIEHFYQPSFQDIIAHFGLGGPSAVYCHLRALAKKGLLRLDDRGLLTGRSRSIVFLRRTPIED